jgi:hypothetical protein
LGLQLQAQNFSHADIVRRCAHQQVLGPGEGAQASCKRGSKVIKRLAFVQAAICQGSGSKRKWANRPRREAWPA